MTEILLQIDYSLLKLMNQTFSFNAGDVFFPLITDLHKNIYFQVVIIPLFLFVFFRKFNRKGITYCLMLFLSLSFGDFFGAQVKNYFQRPRPFENSEIIAIQKSPAGSKSFYSNHASNMMTVAVYTSKFFPAAKVPLYLIALIVSYSRIYNGVHYPSDVLAGGLAGALWGYLFFLLAQKLVSYLERKKDLA